MYYYPIQSNKQTSERSAAFPAIGTRVALLKKKVTLCLTMSNRFCTGMIKDHASSSHKTY